MSNQLCTLAALGHIMGAYSSTQQQILTSGNSDWFPGEWEVDSDAFDCYGDNAKAFLPSVYIDGVSITNWHDHFVFEAKGCEDDPDGLLASRGYSCDRLDLNVDRCLSTFGFLDVPFSDNQDFVDAKVYLTCPSKCGLCVQGPMAGEFDDRTGVFQAQADLYKWASNCLVDRHLEGVYYGYDNSTQSGLGPDGLAWQAVYVVDFSKCNFVGQICGADELTFNLNSTFKLANATLDPSLIRPARIDSFVGNYTIEPRVAVSNCKLLENFAFNQVRISDIDDQGLVWPYFNWAPFDAPVPVAMKYHNDKDTFSQRVSPPVGKGCSSVIIDFEGDVDYAHLPRVSWNATISIAFTADCGCTDTTFHVKTVFPMDSWQSTITSISTTAPAPATTTATTTQNTTVTVMSKIEPPYTMFDTKGNPVGIAGMQLWHWILIGIAASLVIMAVVAGICYFACYRHKKNNANSTTYGSVPYGAAGLPDDEQCPPSPVLNPKSFDLRVPVQVNYHTRSTSQGPQRTPSFPLAHPLAQASPSFDEYPGSQSSSSALPSPPPLPRPPCPAAYNI